MKIEDIKQAIDYKKGHIHLVKWALNKGYSINIEGKHEDISLLTTNDYNKIYKFLKKNEDIELDLFIEDTKSTPIMLKGWAWVIPFNEDEDIIADYTANKFMDEWENEFSKMHEELS